MWVSKGDYVSVVNQQKEESLISATSSPVVFRVFDYIDLLQ